MSTPLYPGSDEARSLRIERYRRERIAAHLAAGASQVEAEQRAAGDLELRAAVFTANHPRGLEIATVLA